METAWISKDSHEQLCTVALYMLRDHSIQWRHHGVGMIQAYVDEGRSRETRLHVHHPMLRYDDIVEHGDIHDHRFDFTSAVLTGQLNHMVFDVEGPGEYEVCTVVPRRQQNAGEADFIRVGEPRALQLAGHAAYKAGTRYTFPKRVLHRAWTDSLTVTLLTKYNQDDAPAMVVGKPELRPAFRQQSTVLIEQARHKAIRALSNRLAIWE